MRAFSNSLSTDAANSLSGTYREVTTLRLSNAAADFHKAYPPSTRPCSKMTRNPAAIFRLIVHCDIIRLQVFHIVSKWRNPHSTAGASTLGPGEQNDWPTLTTMESGLTNGSATHTRDGSQAGQLGTAHRPRRG